MKRRGFLASIAAGLGLAVVPEPKEMEKYYKVETMNEDFWDEPVPSSYDGAVSGSGNMSNMSELPVVACSGVIPSHRIQCSG